MKDSLMEAFFEMDRWEAAIEKGLLKDIDKRRIVLDAGLRAVRRVRPRRAARGRRVAV